jgi:hypothetical protein
LEVNLSIEKIKTAKANVADKNASHKLNEKGRIISSRDVNGAPKDLIIFLRKSFIFKLR